MLYVPSDLPRVRDRIVEWSRNPAASVIFGLAIEGAEVQADDPEAVKAAHYDAALFEEAALFHIQPPMVELLLQASGNVGEGGFMGHDLIAPVGVAYFAKVVQPENPWLEGLRHAEDYNEQVKQAMAEYADFPADLTPMEINERLLAFTTLIYREHLLVGWREVAPSARYPLGGVHLSWWMEREAWWDHHKQVDTVLGAVNENVASLPDRVLTLLPPFVFTGTQFISFDPEKAEAHFAGGDPQMRSRRPDMFRALMYLLRQRVAETTTQRPDRAARRRALRENLPEPPEIRVIGLRPGSPAARSAEPGTREFVHRWVVRGHWRNQFYPSIGERRPIFIAPFIKGPEGAPLLGGQKVYTVGTGRTPA